MTKRTTDLPDARLFLDRLTLGKPETQRRFLAAVSGGLDSMCLLNCVLDWCRDNGGTVAAAHFNHRLRGEAADRDEAFVRDYCTARGVPFLRGEGDTRSLAKRQGLTVEEAARQLRYGFLARAAQEADCAWILTAHHADDNAETMLLNLCRGTGSRGLCGIPAVRDNIARPFLQIPRAELAAYAAAHGIPHVEDETNDEDTTARNLLRHKVLPVLREINPRVAENMARTAAVLIREGKALDLAAEEVSAGARMCPNGLQIARSALNAAPAAVAERAVLDLLGRVCGHRKDLSAVDVGAVLAVAGSGRTDMEARLSCRLMAWCEGEDLVIFRQSPPAEPVPIARGETVRFGDWTVTLAAAPGRGESHRLSLPEAAELSVSAWRPGDRMTLPGARGSRTLKRLCADRGVRPWRRDGLPVLRADGRPAAVPKIGMDVEFTPQEDGTAVFVTFYQETEESDT